ncbi:MAG TPA: 50S ribosomal protein L10 [Gemmataceae bacterium]|nr:50S ribosomal protein L10 [Gemmataceae bacterium]
MSKLIKQMEMDALKKTFQGVRDLVVLSVSGIDATTDNRLRLSLRKKNIRLQVVKNSLTRRVFDELGLHIDEGSPYWAGPTVLAWGANSIAELSRTIDAEVKDLEKKNPKLKDRVKVKGAVTEGQPITFQQAKEMPTKAEAIGQIMAMILGPASQIAGCLVGPASQVASQIAKKAEGAPAEAAAPAAG